MKNNKTTIILGILMMAALVGGVYLSRQNQNTQKGAYFAGTNLLIQPTEITGTIGGQVSAQLFVETDGAKLSSIDTQICYGNQLTLNESDPKPQIELNTAALGTLVDAQVVGLANKCLRIIAIADISKQPSDLLSGMVKVATIHFNAVSVGTGNVTIDKAATKVGGYNPEAGASDSALQVNTITDAVYTITGTETVTPTPTNILTPSPTPGPFNCNRCSTINGCERAQFQSSTGDCAVPIPGTNIIRTTDCTCSQVVGGDNSRCASFCTLSPTPTVPTATPTPPIVVSNGSILKFQMAFFGINNAAQCATPAKMPLSVIVRAADGTTRTMNNVIPVREMFAATNLTGIAVYSTQLPLDNFDYTDNLSVFIKGPKSLQVKYGINGQTAYYNKAGGELGGLTNDFTTTPLFDFTKYPLLAGDVTGPDGTQDGVVDGLDFSFVKTQSIARTEVAAGEYMLADLNGNCKMESQDLAILMLSLKEKQAQLY